MILYLNHKRNNLLLKKTALRMESPEKKDFGVAAEWRFFATSHRKGACDGLGGTIKRQARIASLQRVDDNYITTPFSLFVWAKSFYKNISFDFCTKTEHDDHEKKLENRLNQAL